MYLVNMYLMCIHFVTSASGLKNQNVSEGKWVWSENCCTCNAPVNNGLTEAEVGTDKNLTSLMDPEEGCRWIFKSGSSECCYSARRYDCLYKAHDKEKCKKNHTGYIVHPFYKTQSCILQLFHIGYKDAGEYTQTTTTFNFNIKLTVTRNTEWDEPAMYISGTSLAITTIGIVCWLLWKWYKDTERKKQVETERQEKSDQQKNVKEKKDGMAILGVLRDENEESFRDLSEQVDLLGAKDQENNNLLHLFGMPSWTDKKTTMIYDYCVQKNLFEGQADDEQQILLQYTDKLAKIINLHSMKSNINLTNKLEETPLHVAAKYGIRKAVPCNVFEALLRVEGVDVNAQDQSLWTPLHHASFKEHTEVIKTLLNNTEIEIDKKANDDRTPLLCAASAGKSEACKILLQHGAQIHAITDNRENILHLLAKWGTVNENKGKIEILESIFNQTIEEDCQENKQIKNSFFTAISIEDNQDTMKSMTSENLSLCGTPLEIAVSTGFIEAATLLIKNGAEFRTKLDLDNQQQNMHLLLHAVLRGDKKFADFLLTKDPKLVNIKTNKGETYLHVAVEKLNLNAVILLLNMHIDKNATNSEGKTALELADEKPKPNEKKLQTIILELTKERNDVSRQEIQENIKRFSEDKKRFEQKIEEIKAKTNNDIEVFVKQLKLADRAEKSWRKALKEHDGETENEEKDQEENKRENPTMEKIQSRVTELVNSQENIPIGQMAQVLKILNDTSQYWK